MQITRGIIEGAQKIVVYGPEGIGKSTLASKFPNPLFIDTEGSTKKIDVPRLPKPSSWTMLLSGVSYVKNNPDICDTLIIDTADWAEKLCVNDICDKAQKTGIEDFGYGRGYVYLNEEFGRLLNALEELIELGINVVLTAHAQMRKFEQPDEMGAYDRWEMKLQKKNAPLLKEWADMVLFANYKTYVVNVDDQGAQKGKNKVQGGSRVMYTIHHPCWDAKNRDNLPTEIPLDYSAIAHCIITRDINKPVQQPDPVPEQTQSVEAPTAPPETKPETFNEEESIPKALADLMAANNVTVDEIKQVVSQKGYYPLTTPIANYDSQFINGVLIGAWDQVYGGIARTRDEVPF